jgi:hypothetical protein
MTMLGSQHQSLIEDQGEECPVLSFWPRHARRILSTSSKHLLIDLQSTILTGTFHMLWQRDVGEGEEIQKKWDEGQG